MSTTRTFKRLPREVRERQVLDAAVRVFSQHGFHTASMDEIAEVAGVSKPMVYAYLGSKEELFIACLRREATRLMTAIADVVDPTLGLSDQLWSGLRAFFTFVAAHRDGWSVLYRQARGQEPFATELAAMRGRIIDVIAGMLDRAVRAEGRQLHGTDLEVSAYALVGAGESLADWLADHPDADPDKTAARLMNVAWLGAAQLLRGDVWTPAGTEPPVTSR